MQIAQNAAVNCNDPYKKKECTKMISSLGSRLFKQATASSIFWTIIVGVSPGCISQNIHNNIFSNYYDDLSKSNTPQQRKHILSLLATHPHRNEAICGFIKNWGTRTVDYDLAVLDFLRLYEEDAVITACFMDRLREAPLLIHQIFWNHRWKSKERQHLASPNDETDSHSTLFANRVYINLFTKYRNDPQNRLYSLLFVASMTDDFASVENTSYNNIQAKMNELGRKLQTNAPYLYFDENRNTYVIDESAKKNHVPVKASRQEWTAPRTPLPS